MPRTPKSRSTGQPERVSWLAALAPRARRPAGPALLAALALAACGTTGHLPAFEPSPIAMADPGSPLPADWMRGPFAEIYVRAYQDSNGDGIGDLPGLTQRLDYLKALGVTGLWLMPITESADHDHGYAVVDYRAIEAAYGGLGELDELLAAAHARGLGVILDYVVNHSAATHPAFLHARASDPALRPWYVWAPTHPTGWSIYGSDPWHSVSGSTYFGVFGADMPDWNLREPAAVAYHEDNLRFWLNRGVDGFRFDAVGNLIENGPQAWEAQPESRAFMGQLHRLIGAYARRYLVCEAPADPVGFTADDACGSAFAFGHQGDVLAAARGDDAAIARVAAWGATAAPTAATFLANHDSFAGARVYDQLSGDLAAYRVAAATYLLQPGIPFLYYGEELGAAGGDGSGDHSLRVPMSWTADTRTAGFTTGTPFRGLSRNLATANVAAEDRDPGSLLNYYRALLGLRRARASLTSGRYAAAQVSGRALTFQRILDGGAGAPAERTLVAINYAAAATQVTVPGLPAGATLTPLYPPGTAPITADAAGTATLPLPSHAVLVLTAPP